MPRQNESPKSLPRNALARSKKSSRFTAPASTVASRDRCNSLKTSLRVSRRKPHRGGIKPSIFFRIVDGFRRGCNSPRHVVRPFADPRHDFALLQSHGTHLRNYFTHLWSGFTLP